MSQIEYEGRLYIDGKFREAKSGKRFDVINPADESVVGTAADADADDAYDAVTAARKAADETDWATNHEFRLHCLQQFQDVLRKAADQIRVLQATEGIVPVVASATHIEAMIEGMDYFNGLISTWEWEKNLGPYTLPGLGISSNRVVRSEPYGVVAAITPWNAPFMTNIWKVTHALATGNTVVLKSAPDTPLTGALMAQLAHDGTDIPPGVFNAISSFDKAIVGDALTGDQRVDMYHFTGSPGVGERIAQRAAVGIRKVVLELGGKSANIFLPDADLDMSCGLGVVMCMNNGGQGCALATRMVVHADIYDEVLQRLEAVVGGISVGDPTDPGTIVGPIIRLEQLERMEGLVQRAEKDGARILVGGKRADVNGKGFWFEPTVIVDVDENSEIAQTEVFGPVLTVIKYDGDDDEAVRVANNTRYGLSGYVQSRDVKRAVAVGNRLKAGTVNINNSFYLSPDAPFGGYGISGVGVEHGEAGFAEYLQLKSVATPVI
jgi:aldehyde dehydrogenase (NAD+)